jgi:hypothetical protein
MGICGSIILSEKNMKKENDIDKIILIMNSFIKDRLSTEKIKPFLSDLLYYQIILEKSDFVKSNRFIKWLQMSSILKTFPFYNDINLIMNSFERKEEIKNEKEKNNYIKYDIFYKKGMKEISNTEIGLRNYFIKRKSKFESRMLKSPPSVFRWCSWLILSKTNINREYIYYEKIIEMKINKKSYIEIVNITEDIIKEKCNNSNLIKSCLFRLIKSIIVIDPDIFYLKEIAYILTFLIIVSNFDEINIFYMMISLLSGNEDKKFGLKGFFIKGKPLLNISYKIFEKNFKNLFSELNEHLIQSHIEIKSIIENWIQICYINIFSIINIVRIWDFFLLKGISFLINLCLSLIENFYEDLMNLKSEQDLLIFLKKLNSDKYNINSEIDFNIEEILSIANKKYKFSNEEIYNELIMSYPDYKYEFEYNYKNINEINIKILNNKESINEKLSTINIYYSSNNNLNNNCYSRLDSLINNGYINLEENNNDNIELSISQKNIFGEDNCLSENSFEDIEDENNYNLHEHMKDLKSKQEYLNLNKNYISNG